MSVKVAVRVRPFNQRQKDLKCQCIVDMQNPTTRLKPYKGQEKKDFTFDYSFWSFDQFQSDDKGYMKPTASGKYADQQKVFEALGKSILDNAWQGYHCCLFAYGQTGSGKSYSMIGFGANKGIVPITCNDIFTRIANKKDPNIEFDIRCSMLQIYNEEVQDLTIPATSRVSGGLNIRQNKLLGVYVDGVKKHYVSNFKEIQNIMDLGTKNRTVAATQMNATSSRAHTIITIEFKQIQKSSKTQKISIINLVDLAGSQRQDKTGASGQRLKQAVGINTSLTCLGQVISLLAENSDGKKNFIPYRNSALTRILQNALGGNSQTIMICAVSPANDNYDQTISTLRYAERAKKIKNKPIVNESQSDKLIRQLKAENDRLKKLLEQKGGSTDPKIIPAQNTSQQNVQQGKVQEKKPEQKKPQQKKPEQKKPQQKKPEQKKPEEKKPELIKHEDIKTQQKIPQEKKPQEKKPQEKRNDDGNIEDIKAKMKKLQEMLQNQKKSQAQKQQQAKRDQWIMGIFAASNSRVFGGQKIAQMKKKGQRPPPYLQNISKDLMIDRKIKVLLDRPRFSVGRNNAQPANDLVLGGKDIQVRHAQFLNVNGQIFIKALGYHVYVNGKRIQKEHTIELAHLDRVVLGWNSVFLYKNKDPNAPNPPDKLMGKYIDWWFIKNQLSDIDIDASDDQQGSGGCCEIY